MGPSQTYIRRRDHEEVLLVDADLIGKLNRPAWEYRDKTIFDISSSDVVSLRVQGREGYELSRNAEGWTLRWKGLSAQADAGRVRDLIGKISTLRASDFVADDPRSLVPFGLDSPRLTVWLEVRDEQPTAETSPSSAETQPTKTFKLALGSLSEAKAFAQADDEATVFLVEASLMEDLQPDLDQLRERQILAFDTKAVDEVVLSGQGGELRLSRRQDAWWMDAPYPGQADKEAVEDLLEAVKELQAAGFEDKALSPSVYGLAEPSGRIVLRLVGEDQPKELFIGSRSPSGEMIFVKSASNPSVAVVASDLVEGLLEGGSARYYGRALLAIPPQQRVMELSFAGRPDGDFLLRRSTDEDKEAWMLVEPTEAPADSENVAAILESLKTLSAEKFIHVGPKPPARFAQADGLAELTITTEWVSPPAPATGPAESAAQGPPATAPADQPLTRQYGIAVLQDDGQVYAWNRDAEIVAVGQVNSSLYRTLTAELRERTVWRIDPDKITRVRLATDGSELVLLRQDDGWQCAGDKYVQLDAGKVQEFLQELQTLNAERFLWGMQAGKPTTAPAEVRLLLELEGADGAAGKITVLRSRPEDGKGYRAVAVGVERRFVISAGTLEKLSYTLDGLKK